jgi:hypothetical protein
VHVIGRRDVDRIQAPAFLFQQFAPVLIHADGREALEHPIEPAQVDVGDRDKLECRVLREGVDVRKRLAAGAEAGVAYLPRLPVRGNPEVRRDDGGAGGAAKELTT